MKACWVKALDGVSGVSSFDLDDEANLYITGAFNGTVDFDPGPASHNLQDTPSPPWGANGDAYVASYDSVGNYRWAGKIGSKGQNNGNSISVIDSFVIVTGEHSDSTDFDFTQAKFILTSSNSGSTFLASYHKDTRLLNYAGSFESANISKGKTIGTTSDGSIYLGGIFYDQVDVDLSWQTSALVSLGGADLFLAKYKNQRLTPPPNNAPQIFINGSSTDSFYVVIPEDSSFSFCIQFIDNDSIAGLGDVSGDVTSASFGTSFIQNDSCFQYVPNINFNGSDHFYYRACDGGGLCDSLLIQIHITPINDAPSIIYSGVNTDTIYISIVEDSVVLTCFEFEDPDLSFEGDSLIHSVLNVNNGTAIIQADSCIMFTTSPGFVGSAVASFYICDQANECDTQVIIYQVSPSNTYVPNYSQSLINLQPNPATDKLFLQCYDDYAFPGIGQIRNVLGESMDQFKILDTGEIVIILTEFPSGCYFIVTVDSEGLSKVLQFIKQ